MNFTTLTGIPLADLPALLDAELPAEAYTAVPGGADLTDIDPNYMRKVLNQTFGISGLGWGYTYKPEDLAFRSDVREGSRGDRTVIVATLTHLEFWYLLVDETGQQQRCVVHASGSSENSNHAYAMKGAITSALGNAASNLGFQESVYLGHRSHKTVGKKSAIKPASTPAAASKPAPAKAETPLAAPKAPAPATPPNGNGHKPSVSPDPSPAAVAEIEDLGEPSQPNGVADLGSYVIPAGKNAGKQLSEMSDTWLAWAANEMKPINQEYRALQEAVKAYLNSKGG